MRKEDSDTEKDLGLRSRQAGPRPTRPRRATRSASEARSAPPAFPHTHLGSYGKEETRGLRGGLTHCLMGSSYRSAEGGGGGGGRGEALVSCSEARPMYTRPSLALHTTLRPHAPTCSMQRSPASPVSGNPHRTVL